MENRDSAAVVPFVVVWANQLFGNIRLLAPVTEPLAKGKSHYDNAILHAIRRNAYNDLGEVLTNSCTPLHQQSDNSLITHARFLLDGRRPSPCKGLVSPLLNPTNLPDIA